MCCHWGTRNAKRRWVGECTASGKKGAHKGTIAVFWICSSGPARVAMARNGGRRKRGVPRRAMMRPKSSAQAPNLLDPER
eukprot:4942330-Pyramimonas_sp.AAC.1